MNKLNKQEDDKSTILYGFKARIHTGLKVVDK
jgi:hypothetical protein